MFDEKRIDNLLNANVEYEKLDYKENFDIESTEAIVKIAKDMAAMANSGGGDIVIGVDKNFVKKGLDLSFKIDEADLRNKINRYFQPKIDFVYKEVVRKVRGVERKFAIIHIEPAEEIILPVRDGNYQKDGKQKSEFRRGEILVRDGSQSKVAGPYDVRRLVEKMAFEKRIETERRFVDSILRIIDVHSKPDEVRERLVSNLFPVKSIPEIIWEASTDFQSKEEVYSHLKDLGYSDNIPSFILKGGNVYTFSDLSKPVNPLRYVIKIETINTNKIRDWRKDNNKWRWIIELLHLCLKNYCYEKGLVYDRARSKFFFPATAFKTRTMRWRTPRRWAVRQVVAYYEAGGKGFYLHRAVRLRFVTLGDQIFLMIDPRLEFTFDGRTPVTSERFNKLSNRFTHNQYNALILNDVRFWAACLENTDNGIQLLGLGYQIEISSKPAETELNVGLVEKIPSREREKISSDIQFSPEDVQSTITSEEFQVERYENEREEE